ncbi:MAG TPA: hypothetical protein VK988_05040 [Acidimicrobiales bacterium]|nr:hypothetical protein [Acidimicrobiales bacterium]
MSVLYRPCVEEATVGRLDLYDANDFSGPPIWSAQLFEPAQGKLEIPITGNVPGYAVNDRTEGPLESNREYRVDAQSDDGVSWEGPTFRPPDLRPGEVKESGGYENVDSWVRRTSRC